MSSLPLVRLLVEHHLAPLALLTEGHKGPVKVALPDGVQLKINLFYAKCIAQESAITIQLTQIQFDLANPIQLI